MLLAVNRLLRYVFYTLLAAAATKGAYHLLAQAWFFYQGSFAGDAKYYWTVGQAMLNGFELYGDVFDTKPPAIYLLSALSLWLTHGGGLGFAINGFMTLLLPATFAYAAWRATGSQLRTAIGALFAVTLTLYMGYQGEAWQTEWYGAFFGTLFILAYAVYPSVWLLSVLMFAAIGFKEPFALSLLAGALVLTESKAEFTHTFLKPVGITAVAGVLCLLALGLADGYFGTYLPSHFGGHLSRATPLPLRGVELGLVALNFVQFSYLWFAVALTLVILTVWRHWRHGYLPGIGLVVLGLYLSTLAGNLRGYPANNHFVAVVPFFVALFMGWLPTATVKSKATVGTLTALALLTLPLSDGFASYGERLTNLTVSESAHREAAAKLDGILDACDIDRYYFVEERPYMHHMRHSPLNFFVYTGPETIVDYHHKLIEKQLENFSNAKVVVAEGDAYEIRQDPTQKLLSEMIFRYLANHFTIQPWECAAGLPVPEGYSVLFRKDPENMKPFPFKMQR